MTNPEYRYNATGREEFDALAICVLNLLSKALGKKGSTPDKKGSSGESNCGQQVFTVGEYSIGVDAEYSPQGLLGFRCQVLQRGGQ